jgi:hypothetical protein
LFVVVGGAILVWWLKSIKPKHSAIAPQGGGDKARVALAALVSLRVVRNNNFDARVVLRQCRQLSYHQECTGIAGLRGVRLSSPTEQDDRG